MKAVEPNWALVAATSVYAVAAIATVVVLIVAAMAAIGQLKHMRNDSLRQLVRNLMRDWTSHELEGARKLLREELGLEPLESVDFEAKAKLLKEKLNALETVDRDRFNTLLLVPHYFEMASVLVQPDERTEEALEILKLFRQNIIYHYRLYEAWITSKREMGTLGGREKLTTLYREFEKLYSLALAEEKQQ